MTKEEFEELQKTIVEDLENLVIYFKSKELNLDRIKLLITFFLALLSNTKKIDEEDLREIFRMIPIVETKIIFV